MAFVDRCLGATSGLSPFEEHDIVVAALRRRRRMDVDDWAAVATFVLLAVSGAVVWVAGTTPHRVVLATPVPAVVGLVAGWLRNRRAVRRMLSGVASGDAVAFSGAARFLNREEERLEAAAAWRLAAAHAADPLLSACYDHEAAATAAGFREHERPGRVVTAVIAVYGAAAAAAFVVSAALAVP